jgi:predicted nucleic acid-binding protein
MSREQADIFINGIAALVLPVKTHYLWRPMLRDPNDEMVLEVAVNGRADAIVTFNLRDYGAVPKTFNIEVIKPSSAIRRVRNE